MNEPNERRGHDENCVVICAFLSFVVGEGESTASRPDPFTLWEELPLFIKSRVFGLQRQT